jgi:hypothetical protein
MLNKNDFRSIWDIAHRWEGIEPPEHDPEELSEEVSDKIQKLIWAFRREQITLRHPSGLKVNPDRDDLIDLLILDRTLLKLNKCLKIKKFPRSLINKLFIMRGELLNWCDYDRIEPPAFWDDGNTRTTIKDPQPQGKLLIGRHLTEEMDKNRCQAIALTLWGLDPNIHPAHMAKSKAMQIYGNGRDYKGKDGEYETVKKWIKEVDPKNGERKPGKPVNVRYLIDLETHHLNQE